MQVFLPWIHEHVWSAIAIFYVAYLILVALILLLENREPERTLSWLLVLFTLPVIGFILYLFFGHDWHRKSYEALRQAHFSMEQWKEHARKDLLPYRDTMLPNEERTRTIATSATGFRMTQGNRIRILTDAHIKYPRLIAALKNAKHSIDLEYYIFQYDAIGKEIIAILKEKAQQGVRVRFLVDGYGSFGFGRKAFPEMRKVGIQAHYFAPLITLFYFFKANYRDHRKIVVVDHEVAFTGGINIGDEYLGKSKRGPWRDTSIELRGPCVAQMSDLFKDAWFRTTREKTADEQPVPRPFEDGEPVNVIPSGPDASWFSLHQLYITMINNASRNIKIQTPYYIPDQSMNNALVNAALRGVEVQIVVPKYPDNQFLRMVAATYIGEVLRAGGRVYEYPIGFMHQKVMITDDELATTGTCNVDIRSFKYDFEVNVLLSRKETVTHLIDDFREDLNKCEELLYADFINRPVSRRFTESLIRLIAPLL